MLLDQLTVLILCAAVIVFAIIAMLLVYIFGQAIFFGRWDPRWDGSLWDYFQQLDGSINELFSACRRSTDTSC